MKHSVFFIVALLALFISGCSAPSAGPAATPGQPTEPPPTGESTEPQTPVASHGGPVTDYASLIDALRAGGASVEPAGEVSQSFFSVEGKVIKANGADVQVFEYADEAAAQTDANLVQPDGYEIGTAIVDWMAPPHFYQKGRLMVLYVGTDNAIMAALEATLGAQFAGE
jgi:hypothetical protein